MGTKHKPGHTPEQDKPPALPQHEIEGLARCLLPAIQQFFESEDGKREFEEWKRKQEQKRKSIT